MSYHAGDPPINFSFKQYNDQSTAMKLAYYETFGQPLLQNPDRFKVAVTRLKIPTAGLETFIMDTPSDYSISLFGPSVSNTALTTAITYSNILPTTDVIDGRGCCEGRNMQYYSADQLIDTISRVMYRCFSNWTHGESLSPASISGSVLLSNAATSTTTVTVSSTRNIIGNMRVILKKIKVSDSAIAGDGSFSRINIPIKVWVQPPGSADKVYVYCHAGYHNWDVSNDTVAYELHFHEGGYSSFPEYYYPKGDPSLKLNVLPHESFLSMHGLSMNGTWTIGVDSDRAFYGRVDFVVEIDGIFPSQPYLPAAITLDQTLKKLTFNYQAKMTQSAMKWGLSPKLHYILNMGSNRVRPNQSGSMYVIDYPPLTQTYTGTEMLSFNQEQSTEYLLVNLARIVVRSSSLSTESEYSSGKISDNMITDFMLDSADTTNVGTLIFSESAGVYPWRTYRITSSTPMSRLDLTITADYSNNISRDIFIPPGQSAMSRISFFPM